ncbi:hypothetical protein AALA69_03295 [Eggerthellaceae bacterium 24-137]
MIQTFDLIDRARDHLRANGLPDACAKRLDSFTGKEGTVVRLLSEKTEFVDYAGEEERSVLYQVVARRRSEADAEEACRLAARVLDGAYIPSANGSYRFEWQEVASHANEIELDESLFYAWEVRVRAYITIKR